MKILSVAWKDIQILVKDRGVLIMSFLLPLAFIVVWQLPSLAQANDTNLTSVPVVDLEGGPAAQDLIDRLNRVGGFQVERHEEGEAMALLETNDISWLLVIPADLGAMSADRTVTLRLIAHPDANQVEAEGVQRAINGVAQDMALQNQLLASFQQMDVMMQGMPDSYQVLDAEAYIAQARTQFERAETQPLVVVEQTTPQVEGQTAPMSGPNVTVPGFAVLFVFLTSQVTAASIFQEKESGCFRRLLAAPLPKASLLAGKMLPNLVVTVLQIFVVFAASMVLLPLLGLERLSLGRDPLALIVLSLLTALCSTGVGVLIAGLSHTKAQAGSLSAVVLWVMAAVGGAFVPTFLMGGALQTLSGFVPHSWALRAFYDLLVYGRGLVDILPEMGALLGFTALFFAIGLWRFDY